MRSPDRALLEALAAAPAAIAPIALAALAAVLPTLPDSEVPQRLRRAAQFARARARQSNSAIGRSVAEMALLEAERQLSWLDERWHRAIEALLAAELALSGGESAPVHDALGAWEQMVG